MAGQLRDALEQMLEDWQEDLPAGWSSVLSATTIDFSKVDLALKHEVWEPIFPVRKGRRFPGARSDAHLFRAFDGLEPEDVRVVVLGQDPYPNPAQATGRAFEQGDLDSWPGDPQFIALSLRRIVQAAAYAKTEDDRYIAGDAGWNAVVEDIDEDELRFRRSPMSQFDAWQRQGVMFLNTGLTLSRFEPDHQFRGHLPLWHPVIRTVTHHLATTETPVVFLLWGGKARDAFADFGAKQSAMDAGTWEQTVDVFTCGHPAWPRFQDEATHFLDPNKNTFLEANAALERMGARGVRW